MLKVRAILERESARSSGRRSTTSTSTMTSFKQNNSSCKRKRMNNLLSSAFSSPSSLCIQHQRDNFYLFRMSARKVKKLTLNSTPDCSHFRRTGMFRSHKTTHEYLVRWSINRGFFKCWYFRGRCRLSWRLRFKVAAYVLPKSHVTLPLFLNNNVACATPK